MKTKLRPQVKRIILSALLLASITGQAQEWTSIQDGNWNDPATWNLSSIPPSTLNAGMSVTIEHSVTLPNTFTSSLSITKYAALNILGGTFIVETGISMDNRGRFIGLNGSLLQCLYVGCGISGAQASGVWNTLDGGYTRMDNMIIQIAQDWTTTNGGKRYHRNCCVKTGQNFSINNELNRDTLINSRFELGLHGSGNFQQNKGKVVYDNIDIDIAGSGGGNVQFNGGNFKGAIRTIRIQNINGSIQASPSMTGSIDLGYYCIQVPANYQDPSDKIKNEVLDCPTVANLLASACSPGGDGGGFEERAGFDRPQTEVINDRFTSAGFYPNPFIKELRIQFRLENAGAVTLTLTDLSGRQVYRIRQQATTGINIITADNLGALHPGIYIAEVSTVHGMISRTKLIKK